MTELTNVEVYLSAFEKAMDLPAGAKIASIIQDPVRPVVHILIAHEKLGEEIQCTKLSDIGKGFWEYVPDHLRVVDKGKLYEELEPTLSDENI